jgi:glutathione S-transferase
MRFIRQLEAQFAADEAAQKVWRRYGMALGLDALEALAVQMDEAGPFLGGSAPNLADICLVPQLYNARRFDLPLGGYPRLVAADAAAATLSAFADAHPDRFIS